MNFLKRHNGNILIDNVGHLVHIDFGFIFSMIGPGGLHFETAPFKLTQVIFILFFIKFIPIQEYVEFLGGEDSDLFLYFKIIMMKGFLELKKHASCIVNMILIMKEKSSLPCFKNFDLELFRSRFLEKKNDNEVNLK